MSKLVLVEYLMYSESDTCFLSNKPSNLKNLTYILSAVTTFLTGYSRDEVDYSKVNVDPSL